MTAITRWWWIRHAPVRNQGGRIYGALDVDCDCSETHLFQGAAAGLPDDAVWLTTPLRRTRQTADALAAVRKETPYFDVEPAFQEQSFGDWQGLTHEEIYASQPENAHRFWLAPSDRRTPGGESFADLAERVGAGLAARNQAHHGRNIISVAHGGTIRAVLGLALGIPLDRALQFRVDNISITRLDYLTHPEAEPAWRVVAVNVPPGGLSGI